MAARTCPANGEPDSQTFSVWHTVQRSVLATSRVRTFRSLSLTVAASAVDAIANAQTKTDALRPKINTPPAPGSL